MIDSIANSVVNYLCPPEGAANMPHDQMVARAYGRSLLVKREWHGLTPHEIKQIWDDVRGNDSGGADRFARAIEAKLKEKNHG